MKKTVAIVGCGKVGSAFGIYLGSRGSKENGYRHVGFASKTLGSAQKASARAGSHLFTDRPIEATQEADIVLITTPDDVIESVCREIAEQNGFKKGGVVLHCSGALPSTILKAASQCHAFVGSIHPLQSFSSDEFDENPFNGIIAAIEGDPAAAKEAARIAEALGARPIAIRTDAKVLYHAAAVVASNYLVTLIDFAFKLIEQAGVSENEALDVLKPLIDGTLENIKKFGVEKALTGPIARGDVATVESHVQEIEKKVPGLLELYKTLASHTIGVARAGKMISESAEKSLCKLVKG